MATACQSSNKAKIARRVVEVLEFFDEDNPEATVMDIVRRYDRPQSSTSELLSSLVELGILHKDPSKRSYRPTVRAALLGTESMDDVVRDGRMTRFMDRLYSKTESPVVLFGKIDLESQIVAVRRGEKHTGPAITDLYGGSREPLTASAAGLLLLSTLPPEMRARAIRRLNSEANERDKFDYSEMTDRVAQCAERKSAFGPVGFGSRAAAVTALLPCRPQEHPLVVGIVTEDGSAAAREAHLHIIDDAVRNCLWMRSAAPAHDMLTAA